MSKIKIFIVCIILLPLLTFGWHWHLTRKIQGEIENITSANTDLDLTIEVELNPITNLVSISIPLSDELNNPLSQAMPTLGEALIKTISPGIIERELDTRARENYDIYAMLISYRARVNTKLSDELNSNGDTKSSTAGDEKGWDVNHDKNPLDDTETVTLSLGAKNGMTRWGMPVTLILRCKGGNMDVYISWNSYLGDHSDVTYRFGTGKQKRSTWRLSTDKRATFYPDNEVIFIKKLMTVDNLVAQVTPSLGNPITAVFELKGLREAARPLKTYCGWR